MNRVTSIDIDGKGWMTNQLRTRQDCDAAEIYLGEAVAKIQSQLSDPERNDPEWRRTAQVALRLKRQAMQIVQRKRGELNLAQRRWSGRFVEAVKTAHPEVYQQVAAQI